jgi:5-methylcytosine-specific restriction endonuclease McrA
MKTYSQKLLSPKWQKKRLEILNRDEFTCQYCYNKERTLHVHHMSYEYGKEPWEYVNENFITLCCDCHETETFHRQSITDTLTDLYLMGYSHEQVYYYICDMVNRIKPQFRNKDF